jgi:hypothetical protein
MVLVDEGGHHAEGDVIVVLLQMEYAKHGSWKLHACEKSEKSDIIEQR